MRITRHKTGVESAGSGYCAEYQPVQDGKEHHRKKAHHDGVGGDVGHVVLLATNLTPAPGVFV